MVQHYKGALYRVVGPARHTETGERLIVYHPVNRPYELWARPADMYGSEVSLSNGLTVARFRRVYPKTCVYTMAARAEVLAKLLHEDHN